MEFYITIVFMQLKIKICYVTKIFLLYICSKKFIYYKFIYGFIINIKSTIEIMILLLLIRTHMLYVVLVIYFHVPYYFVN